ncbi:hypothetical protein CMI46_03370 [Candidatus Pacearchaeota archaeon]|nr:hypothetical protein [Candidatus Pacearchaeota archaeon]|tara:strand:- start:5014 stop:5211 length:198 start_codon:yes stop_codon:yes gene_type:complete
MDLKKGLSALVFSSCLLASGGCNTLYDSNRSSFNNEGSFAELGHEQRAREMLEKNRAGEGYSVEE